MNAKSNFIPILVFTAVVVIVITGIFYYSFPNKTDTTQLEKSLNTTKNKVAEEDSRILLSRSMYATSLMLEVKNLDISTSTELLPYKDSNFEVMLPYNKNWGNDMYKLAPFEVRKDDFDNNVITFGPIDRFEGGGLTRSGTIKIGPHLSKESLIATHNTVPDAVVYDGNINEYDVVVVGEGSFQTHTAYIIGQKNNLEVHFLPLSSEFDNVDSILSIVKTARLLDL